MANDNRQTYYKGYEDDNIVFDWDDPDFASCSPPNSHQQRSGSQRRSTGSSYSSSCFSIPEEAESDPIMMNNYAAARHERTGFYARSLPVQIPLYTVRAGSNPARPSTFAAAAPDYPSRRSPRVCASLSASVATIAATATMRQGEVVDGHHAHHADNRCSSPSWYSERGILTLEDIRNQYHNTQTMLTLEELKDHYNSCFTCGVSWNEEHVSLDCFECGGYSMERPCPMCDGKCNRVWRRDITMSHAMNKAHWEGECGLPTKDQEALYLKNLVDATEDSITEALQDLKAAS